MKVLVQRSYLARIVQTYELDLPDGIDAHAAQDWLDDDPPGFDQHVCDRGELRDDHDEQLDEWQLDTRIIDTDVHEGP